MNLLFDRQVRLLTDREVTVIFKPVEGGRSVECCLRRDTRNRDSDMRQREPRGPSRRVLFAGNGNGPLEALQDALVDSVLKADRAENRLERLQEETVEREVVAQLVAGGAADEQRRLLRPLLEAVVCLGLERGPSLNLMGVMSDLASVGFVGAGPGRRMLPPAYVEAVLLPLLREIAQALVDAGKARWVRDDELHAVNPDDQPEEPLVEPNGPPAAAAAQDEDDAAAQTWGEEMQRKRLKSVQAWPRALGGIFQAIIEARGWVLLFTSTRWDGERWSWEIGLTHPQGGPAPERVRVDGLPGADPYDPELLARVASRLGELEPGPEGEGSDTPLPRPEPDRAVEMVDGGVGQAENGAVLGGG